MGKENAVSVHAMEYYSALQKEGTLTHATAGVNSKDLLPHEISQSEMYKCHMTPLMKYLE